VGGSTTTIATAARRFCAQSPADLVADIEQALDHAARVVAAGSA